MMAMAGSSPEADVRTRVRGQTSGDKKVKNLQETTPAL